jgi:hypothetical protein
MVLLAGEYVQGRGQWFNRALEHVTLALFPRRLFFLNRNPLIIAKGIVRKNVRYILSNIVFPIMLLVSMLTSIDRAILEDDKVVIRAALNQAINDTDPKARDRAYAALQARASYYSGMPSFNRIRERHKG